MGSRLKLKQKCTDGYTERGFVCYGLAVAGNLVEPRCCQWCTSIAKVSEMIGIKWQQHLASLCVLFFLASVVHAGFLPAEAEDTKTAPEAERVFVVKISENLLHETAEKIVADPENKKDGFIWARKVLARHSLGLRDLARELSASEMAAFYDEKAGLIASHIRGEISNHQFEVLERDIETRKRSYLDGVLARAKPGDKSRLDALKRAGEQAARMIHAASVLGAD